MQVTLVMFKADGQRKDFPLTKPSVVLGRRHTCDLRIPIPSISREHCKIDLNNGTAVLEDMKSSNGTGVNGERIEKKTKLKAGDRITIGPVHFIVVVDGKPKKIEAFRTVIPSGQEVAQQASPEDSVADALSEAASPIADLDDSQVAALSLDDSGGVEGISLADSDAGDAISLDDSDGVEAISLDDTGEGSELDMDIDIADSGEIATIEEPTRGDIKITESTNEISISDDDDDLDIGLAEESGGITIESDDSGGIAIETDAPKESADDDDDDPFADLGLDDFDDDDMIITELDDDDDDKG